MVQVTMPKPYIKYKIISSSRSWDICYESVNGWSNGRTRWLQYSPLSTSGGIKTKKKSNTDTTKKNLVWYQQEHFYTLFFTSSMSLKFLRKKNMVLKLNLDNVHIWLGLICQGKKMTRVLTRLICINVFTKPQAEHNLVTI